jgi:divalent metal cation (Fe/Co/Zn/Cd) transporter
MYIGADEVLVTLVATFDPNTALRDVADAIERIEQRIRSRFPKIRRIYCEAVNVGNPRANAPSLRAGAAHGR